MRPLTHSQDLEENKIFFYLNRLSGMKHPVYFETAVLAKHKLKPIATVASSKSLYFPFIVASTGTVARLVVKPNWEPPQ